MAAFQIWLAFSLLARASDLSLPHIAPPPYPDTGLHEYKAGLPGNRTEFPYTLAKRDLSSPTVQIITATQSGKTVVGTYALETLSGYSKLRQTITVTLTTTTTSPNGALSVATDAAVVAAGGFFWGLVGKLG
jgi:hypothetical protein